MNNIPLIFLNGTVCDEELWRSVTDLLDHQDVIIKSPIKGQSVDDCARLLLKNLPKKFCVVGFSLGAIVALHMIRRAPERLVGTVLIAVNPLPLAADTILMRSEMLKEAQNTTLRALIEEKMWKNYVAPQQHYNMQIKKTIIDMAERMGMETFIQQSQFSLSRKDCRVAFSQYRSPVLLISGEQDKLCLPQWHRDLASLNHRSTWKNIEDSGHFIPLEAPEACAGFLRKWLACLPEYTS
ncbi:alpha/beta hydrolase [Salmonella enterica]|nr:alpha/beta hydrolase [Salmonella enterica]